VARADGGDDTIENGTVGCATCNLATGTTHAVAAAVDQM
jgi:hypothetical protein